MIRAPQGAEMDAVYLMGFDAWGDGDDVATHLQACRSSAKYAAGQWFVLDVDGQAVASLIVYQQRYRLPPDCYGIGSVATSPGQRRRGYAAALIKAVVAQLVNERQAKAVLLHTDIGLEFYRRLGFEPVAPDSHCMVRKARSEVSVDVIPDYF